MYGIGCWPTVEYVLKRDGYFPAITDKGALEVQYQTIYTLCSVLQNGLRAVQGFLLDKYGMWASRTIFMIMMLIGGLMCAFVNMVQYFRT